MVRYIGMKIDVVRSRKVRQRRELQERLLASVACANEKFSAVIAAKFVVTHGDEIQGLLVALDSQLQFVTALEHFHDALCPHRIRFGIGLGTVETPIHEFAIGTDGPVWHRAKAAIEEAARTRVGIAFHGFGFVDDPALSSLANLLLWLRTRRSNEQKEVVSMLEAGQTQADVARALNVSPAAVSKRLDAAGWRHYRQARHALNLLLERATKEDESDET